MMTVRFPDGLHVTYNNATYIEHLPSGCYRLRAGEGGLLQAFAPAGAIVEFVKPCAISNTVASDSKVLKLAGELIASHQVRSWSDLGVLTEIKSALRDFDARKRRWKDA